RDVGSAVDFAAAGEQGAVGEIEHLGLGLLRGDVVERDMSRRATDEGGVGDTRPHSAGTDDCQFRVLDHGVKVTGCRPLGRDVLGPSRGFGVRPYELRPADLVRGRIGPADRTVPVPARAPPILAPWSPYLWTALWRSCARAIPSRPAGSRRSVRMCSPLVWCCGR